MLAKLQSQLPSLFMVIIALIMVHFCLDARQLYQELNIGNRVTTRSADTRQHAVANTQLPLLTAMPLFGKQNVIAAAPNLLPHNPDYSLVGVVIDSNARHSQAFIRDTDHLQHVYSPQQKLLGGATLIAVFNDHVVLGDQHHRWQLSLPRDSATEQL